MIQLSFAVLISHVDVISVLISCDFGRLNVLPRVVDRKGRKEIKIVGINL